MKAGLVHRHITLAAHVGRQVQRKAVGVVQLESHLARQYGLAPPASAASRISMPFSSVSKKRSSSTRSTSMMRSCCVGLQIAGRQSPMSLPPGRAPACGRTVSSCPACSHGGWRGARCDAAHSRAPHCWAPHRRLTRNAVARMWSAITRRLLLFEVFCNRSRATGGLDQRVKNVDLVVAVHMLQDGGQPLQAHAGVHAGRGQA